MRTVLLHGLLTEDRPDALVAILRAAAGVSSQ
jgi:hypothetical protein